MWARNSLSIQSQQNISHISHILIPITTCKSLVAYFCHHLSDNYVDLSDLYVVLLDLYVDLSDLYVVLLDLYVDFSVTCIYVDLSDHTVDLSE